MMNNILDLIGNIITSILYAMPALPLAISIAVVYKLAKGREARTYYAIGLAAFVLYMYAMLDLTLISRVMNLLQYPAQPVAHSVSLVPFDNMVTMATTHYEGINYNVFARNVFGNIIMFIPLGFCMPALFGRLRSFRKTVLLAAAMSLAIEFLQYWVGGVSDIDDLMMNTLGACIGYAAYAMAIWLAPHLKRKPAVEEMCQGYAAK